LTTLCANLKQKFRLQFELPLTNISVLLLNTRHTCTKVKILRLSKSCHWCCYV